MARPQDVNAHAKNRHKAWLPLLPHPATAEPRGDGLLWLRALSYPKHQEIKEMMCIDLEKIAKGRGSVADLYRRSPCFQGLGVRDTGPDRLPPALHCRGAATKAGQQPDRACLAPRVSERRPHHGIIGWAGQRVVRGPEATGLAFRSPSHGMASLAGWAYSLSPMVDRPRGGTVRDRAACSDRLGRDSVGDLALERGIEPWGSLEFCSRSLC